MVAQNIPSECRLSSAIQRDRRFELFIMLRCTCDTLYVVQVRVAVFAKGDDAAAATAAGADIVGGEDLLASVLEGEALVA